MYKVCTASNKVTGLSRLGDHIRNRAKEVDRGGL